MLSTRQLHRSNNQPANYAALTQFAPEPCRSPLSGSHGNSQRRRRTRFWSRTPRTLQRRREARRMRWCWRASDPAATARALKSVLASDPALKVTELGEVRSLISSSLTGVGQQDRALDPRRKERRE